MPNPPLPDLIEPLLVTAPGVSRLVIGFSGGLDSTVLLHLARAWQYRHPDIAIMALHVNHQLQSAADAWQRQCEQVCREWQIPFIAERIAVDRDQASLEQAARAARYEAFRRHAGAGDLLLLAHHRDDQVETLFQRLLRGSGPLGLGGMGMLSRNEGLLIGRPLLEQDRSELEEYARQHGLRWIDDPSNQDQAFERNFLRQDALPRLRARWPRLNQTVARAARLSREVAELLDDLAEQDGAGQCRPGEPLPLHLLENLPRRRARNLLRHWIRLQGAGLPSEAQLERGLDDLVFAAPDTQPELQWGAHRLRRFRHALYCLPVLPAPDVTALTVTLDQLLSGDLAWAGGRILHRTHHGVAFSRSRLQQGPLVLRGRRGGERLKPVNRATNTLKHWLQDCQVPPWWRERWPLLYCGDRLSGLPGLLVSEGFQPLDAADALWLDWQPLPSR